MRALDKLADQRGESRDQIIQRAIREYLVRHVAAPGDEAFGLWRGRGIDGLEHQEKARSEW